MDLNKYRKVIYSKRLKIRPIDEKDTDLLVKWRNQDYIRNASRLNKKITSEEHKKWFKDSRKHRLDFIFIDIVSDVPIGVVSFDLAESPDSFKGYFEMSKYIGNKDYLGKGLAYEVCDELFNFLKKENSLNGIYAITKKDNYNNIKLNLKLEFEINDQQANAAFYESGLLLMKRSFKDKEGIFLRELKELDFNAEYVGWHMSAHTSFYSGSNRVFTKENLIEEFQNGIENQNMFHYGIHAKNNEKLIGVLKLGIIDWSNLSSDMTTFIGDTNYLGKGLAIKAINRGNEIAFYKHKLRKLYGGMYYDNIPSLKAYLRAGWVIEGVLKDHYIHNEKSQDRILVACFNPNFYEEDFHRNGLYSFDQLYNT
jgi:[ribosomal protein S5]-alanine N-acetyltransferase